ncbi:MAG: chemotaxis protein CheC [Xylanivirga thermophila]|uniref:chemotaxis protein CheC n=1 Tax=Xylanivirga thermophila TaxID=2496273 RepID=UPI00101C4DBD|nr:chemotaxis protein CheC [Xylanivirga thermophila]
MGKDDLMYDILQEIFNIGVGKAANMLSEMINKKILLDVPTIEILNCEELDIDLAKCFPKISNGTLMVSSIAFEEKLTGEANLIFPADKMRRFINLCIDHGEIDGEYEMSFTDIDFDIIREVGNIILNSVIGEIGNFLDVSLEYTLPTVRLFNRMEFENDISNKEDIYMLMLYITFIIDDTEIEGAIIINLTLNSLNELIQTIEKMEDGLHE